MAEALIKRGAAILLVLMVFYGLFFGGSLSGITGLAVGNASNETAKSIGIKLEYKSNTVYDEDNNGIEPIGKPIDFTVESTDFNWAVEESKLCTKWSIYSTDDDALTTVCHGSGDCCAFVDLAPRRELWKDPLYLAFGELGSGFNNIVNAQIIYADYNISQQDLKADIAYSEWLNLTAKFFLDKIPFRNVCIDTCSLKGLNRTSLKLIVEIENAELSIDSLSYSIVEAPLKVKSDVSARDSEGGININYKILKDGNLLNQPFINPDLYDIEISPSNEIVEKITFEGVNYTSPIRIGIDEIKREIQVSGIDINKKFAVDPSSIEFKNATLTSVAAGNILYKCRLWDFEREVCFGEWEEAQNLTEGQPYNLTLTEDDPGFLEGRRKLKMTPKLESAKRDFKLQESPSIDFEFITKEELVKNNRWSEIGLQEIKEKRKGKWISANETIEAFVYDKNGRLAKAEVEISRQREGRYTIDIPKKRAFKPGLYSIEVRLAKDNTIYTQQQNFTWGVLSINVNKSIYQPNQFAFIGIGVLDDLGKTFCEADVTLEIISPLNQKITLTTSNDDIVISEECRIYGLTGMPDYYTYYTVGGEGDYILNLTAVTKNGVRNVQDNFSVQANVDFDVERKGPTRIYPFKVQTMSITIKANQNYKGNVKEYSPSSFLIIPQQGLATSDFGDTKTLSWDIDLKKNDIINLYYQFDAPDISPEFYLLGALEIGSFFAEARQWQIANDAATLADDGMSVNGTKAVTSSNGSVFFVQANLSGSAAEPSGMRIGIMDDGAAIGNNSCAGSADFMCNATQVSCTGTICTNFHNCTAELGDFHPSDTISFNFTIRACSGNEPPPSFNIISLWQNGSSEEFDLDVNITINDTTRPTIVTSINNSAPKYGDVVNITANATDESSLSWCKFAINHSANGAKEYFNKTAAGTSDQCSQNFTIALARGGVINFSVIVNDTANNINQSDQIITVANKEPSISLNAPSNNSVASNSYMILNATITDADNDLVDIYAWGSNDTSLFNTSLLYIAKAQGSSNGGVNITYNWTSPAVQPDNATLLLMHFDNRSEFGETTAGASNRTFDFSDESNHGTIYGAVWNATGKIGGAFEFNGANGFINSTLVQTGVTNYTIEAWVKTRADQGVIVNNRGGGAGLSITLAIGPLCTSAKGNYCTGSAAGIPAVGVDSNGIWVGINGLTAINDGKWHHVAGVFNSTSGGSVTPSSFRIYVDGQLESGNTGAISTATSPLTGVNETRIGWHRPWLIYFSGAIDEVVIHNRTLSGAEVLDHYRLKPQTYYWKVNSTDGELTSESGMRQFRIDSTVPVINGTVNNTSPKIHDIVNATFNATDNSGLSTGQIIINDTGFKSYFNFTLSGAASQFSQNFTVSCPRGCVINITGIANDGFNSRQSESIIIVANTPPNTPLITYPTGDLKTNRQPLDLNATFTADADGDELSMNYYINGRLNQTSLTNTTLNASDGTYILNVSLSDGTDSTANASVNFTIDTTKPASNASINNSAPRTGFAVNVTANASDSLGLSFCQFVINQSGAKEFFNKSINGNNDQCSQNFTITLGGSVINFSVIINDTAGNVNQTDIIAATVPNAAPAIRVFNSSGFSVDPTEAGDSFILISFNATDSDGVDEINASKAAANFTLGGSGSGSFRFNSSCANHTIGASVIINCAVAMRYYDNASSLWRVNLSVEDVNGGIGRNDSLSFTYNSLTAAAILNSSMDFSNVTLNQNNAPAKAPIKLNNTGNAIFSLINLTAAQFTGVSNTSMAIQPANFVVNLSNSTTGAGQQLSNFSLRLIDITGGNASLQFGAAGASNISIFFFLDVPSSGLISQQYNSTWNLTLLTS